MLHRLRQNRYGIGMFLVPVLLVIWLSFTCQNCFASDKPVIEKSHACCHNMQVKQEQANHHHDGSKVSKTDCNIHSTQQSDIQEGFSLEKQMPSLAGPARHYGSDYLKRHRSGIYPLRIEPLHLSSIFETYRVLLI